MCKQNEGGGAVLTDQLGTAQLLWVVDCPTRLKIAEIVVTTNKNYTTMRSFTTKDPNKVNLNKKP